MNNKIVGSVVRFLAIVMTLFLCVSQRTYAQENAPCYVNVNGQFMHVVTGTLESCARTIQAAGYGQVAVGQWGNHEVAVDQNSNIYVDGQPAGRARNPSGTYGSLMQRCQNGDIRACEQFKGQADKSIQQYDRMYPPGWNR
jgi:hypothetical protein